MIADKRNLRRGHALKICSVPIRVAVACPPRIRGAHLIWNDPSHFRLLSAACDRYLEFRSFELEHWCAPEVPALPSGGGPQLEGTMGADSFTGRLGMSDLGLPHGQPKHAAAGVADGRYSPVAHNSMRSRIRLNRCRMLAGGQDRALWM